MALEDADDLATFFDADEHGTAAVYRTAAGAETAVTVILSRGDVTVSMGSYGVQAVGQTAMMTAGQIGAEPAKGDEIIVASGKAYVIDKVMADSTRRVFTLELLEP